MAEAMTFDKPLEKMTAKELREAALKIEGISGVHAMNKPELIEAIREALGIESTGKQVDSQAIRTTKAKIKGLRVAQSAANESGEDKKANGLRRRISRLKKKTRRLAAGA